MDEQTRAALASLVADIRTYVTDYDDQAMDPETMLVVVVDELDRLLTTSSRGSGQ
jgi:hypothetical protein